MVIDVEKHRCPRRVVLGRGPNRVGKLEVGGNRDAVVEQLLIPDDEGDVRVAGDRGGQLRMARPDLDSIAGSDVAQRRLFERDPVAERHPVVAHPGVDREHREAVEAFRDVGGNAARVGSKLHTLALGPREVLLTVDRRRARTLNPQAVVRKTLRPCWKGPTAYCRRGGPYC